MSRKLSNWLDAYVAHTQHSEAPDKFHFWTGVSTIAGALRRKVWIDEGYFTWLPNMFIFFVSPAGIVSKSTTASIGMDILEEVPGIHFGPASGTWQALVQKMSEIQEDFLLPNGEYFPMSAITVVASELGTFFDPRNRDQTDVLVSLWDGKQGLWTKWTKQDGEEAIVNPWINVIGCTTPSWVAENLSDYFTGGGMASRSIFVYADEKRKLVAYPHRHIPKDFKKQRSILLNDLEEIANMAGEFTLTEDAIEFGEKWYEKHYASDHAHLQGEKFAGYIARKQTHIHKLSMVLSAAEDNDLIITADHLKRANAEITKIEHEMPLVFAGMNRETEVGVTNDILLFLRSSGKVPSTRLYREFMRVISYDTFEKCLRSLRSSGLIKIGQPQGENRTYVWVVNPDDLEEDQKNVESGG